MTPTTVTHATFSIERSFRASQSRVFRAFADAEQKARWFVGPKTSTELVREHDFRVGGRDRLGGRFESGVESLYTAHYHQIVPSERLVYTYDMHINGKHLSVSIATVELFAEGDATRMLYTEQAVYFDSPDGHVHRESGTRVLFGQLAASVEG